MFSPLLKYTITGQVVLLLHTYSCVVTVFMELQHCDNHLNKYITKLRACWGVTIKVTLGSVIYFIKRKRIQVMIVYKST